MGRAGQADPAGVAQVRVAWIFCLIRLYWVLQARSAASSTADQAATGTAVGRAGLADAAGVAQVRAGCRHLIGL